MAKAKKITKKELEEVTVLKKNLDSVITNIGVLETQKHALLHKVAEVNEKLANNKKELEDKYGSINIDLETGEYTKIEKEEE
jgi:hypothetical protein